MKGIDNHLPISNNERVERTVLKRMILASVLVIVLYTIHDSIYVNVRVELVSAIATVVFFISYLACYAWVHFTNNFQRVKPILFSYLLLSMVAGFFVHSGFRGVIAMDFANAFILLSILFRGTVWRVFTSIFILLAISFFYIEFVHPEWITNTRENDALWLDLAEVMARIAMSFALGQSVTKAYEREQDEVVKVNLELQQKNAEVLEKTIELEKNKEELQTTNERLNELVAERTKKLVEINERLVEYAFFNAHKVRGPLARILGVVKVVELHKSKSALDLISFNDYTELYKKAALELDEVVKEINLLLEEREKSVEE